MSSMRDLPGDDEKMSLLEPASVYAPRSPDRCRISTFARGLAFAVLLAVSGGEAAAGGEADLSAGFSRHTAGRLRFDGLVSVDGRKIYLECIGSGTPTVVLISGGFEAGWIYKYALFSTDLALDSPTDDFSAGHGDARKLERAAFPNASGFARVCNYDRPNTTLGDAINEERGGKASTKVSQPHTVAQDVADLHKVLTNARVPGPYVLVAHSYGGFIAELYARTYPREVAGRVLIDVTTVFLQQTLSAEELQKLDDGVMALNPANPEAERLMILDAMSAIESAGRPPRVPVFLLSADKPGNLEPATLELLGNIRKAHDLLAADLCAKHMKKTNSGHHIFAEQPQLVNDAIREVVQAARSGCTTIPCKGVPPATDPSITLPACAATP